MYRKTTLSNGLRVVTKKLESTKAVTVLVLVGAGSRYEKKEINGISHFLEHMFFKGAKKYKNAKEVSEVIDAVGGKFNAFTGKEYAGYYVKVASEKADTAFDVLSDMMLHSRFDQAEIDKERGVILEEYNMYQDTPMYQIGWDFEGLVYGDQPLGWDQIGTKELIQSVMHEDFVKYKSELYTSDNTIIAVCGNIDHDEAIAKIEKYFDMEEGKKAYGFEKVKKAGSRAGSLAGSDGDGGVGASGHGAGTGSGAGVSFLSKSGRVHLKEKKTEQAHLVLGVEAFPETHPDHWILKVLSVILGGNMSSRMFLNVREAYGLAYYIRTNTDDYMDTGLISTTAGVDVGRAEMAVEKIMEQYRLIAGVGVAGAGSGSEGGSGSAAVGRGAAGSAGSGGGEVSARELDKAKNFLKGKMVLGLEDSEEYAHLLGKFELLHNEPMTPEEIMRAIDKVTIADVARVAGSLFGDASRFRLAIIGPYSDVEKFDGLLG